MATDTPAAAPVSPNRTWLNRWEPEDETFWRTEGSRLAWRTLWITTANLIMAFIVWFVVSALVVRLPGIGFKLTSNQLFWLAAMPGLAGGTLRIVYFNGGRQETFSGPASLTAGAQQSTVQTGAQPQVTTLPSGVPQKISQTPELIQIAKLGRSGGVAVRGGGKPPRLTADQLEIGRAHV